MQVHDTGGAVLLLHDVQLGVVLVLSRGLAHELPMQQPNDVGRTLDVAAVPQVAHLRWAGSLVGLAVELRQQHNRHIEFLGR